MTDVVTVALLMLAHNALAWIIYEKTRRKVYLRLFLIGNTFVLLISIFIIIIFLWRTH